MPIKLSENFVKRDVLTSEMTIGKSVKKVLKQTLRLIKSSLKVSSVALNSLYRAESTSLGNLLRQMIIIKLIQTNSLNQLLEFGVVAQCIKSGVCHYP